MPNQAKLTKGKQESLTEDRRDDRGEARQGSTSDGEDWVKSIEVRGLGDGSEIQKALGELTRQKTAPNVFIGGNHIGGCDTVTSTYKGGKLLPLLTEVGALTTSRS
ncbi:hypothetical protein GIB67_037783 [Kingdonia uniflora]|uniref:Glutaredoxin domain-containing protein n=1 Tax=Kingdonia uniflora TaxID=39325 RepID=A0A7J7LV10_9MAGN|nr:hypothetical protein GIB67_037783 [Kingdonia uniflora]